MAGNIESEDGRPEDASSGWESMQARERLRRRAIEIAVDAGLPREAAEQAVYELELPPSSQFDAGSSA